MALDPITVAKSILKTFAENEVVRAELPIAVQVAKKFVEYEHPKVMGRLPIKQVAHPFLTNQRALKLELLEKIKSEDWLSAAEICKKIDLGQKVQSAVKLVMELQE